MARPARPATSSPGKRDAAAKAPPGGLSPAELTLLSLFGKEAKKWRDVLVVGGQQKADFFIWLKGSFDVDPDATRVTTALPDTLELVEYIFNSLPPKQRDTLRSELVRDFKDGRRPVPASREIKQLATSALELITTRETVAKRGDVRLRSLEVTRLPRGRGRPALPKMSD